MTPRRRTDVEMMPNCRCRVAVFIALAPASPPAAVDREIRGDAGALRRGVPRARSILSARPPLEIFRREPNKPRTENPSTNHELLVPRPRPAPTPLGKPRLRRLARLHRRSARPRGAGRIVPVRRRLDRADRRPPPPRRPRIGPSRVSEALFAPSSDRGDASAVVAPGIAAVAHVLARDGAGRREGRRRGRRGGGRGGERRRGRRRRRRRRKRRKRPAPAPGGVDRSGAELRVRLRVLQREFSLAHLPALADRAHSATRVKARWKLVSVSPLAARSATCVRIETTARVWTRLGNAGLAEG
ncbi:hypothetical protein ACHAWF_008793 [Thalassiosira exigua]